MPGDFVMIANPSHRAIAKVMGDLGRKFRTWRPAFKAMAPFVLKGIDENVRAQGRTIGETWAPLAASTQRRRARLGRGRGPLIDTGAHIAHRTGSGSGVTIKMTATKMKLGLDGLIPNVQHFGRRDGKLPARRFMDWNPMMEAAALTAMEAHSRRLIAEAAAQIERLARGPAAEPSAGRTGRSRDARGRFTRGA